MKPSATLWCRWPCKRTTSPGTSNPSISRSRKRSLFSSWPALAWSKLSECYARQGEYAQRLADAQQNQAALNVHLISARDAYADCKNRLGEADQATMAASAHLEEIKNRYAAATAEVTKLAGQCEALKRATQNAADAVFQGNVNLNKASAAVKQTEADIQSTNRELQLAQTQWQAAGDAIKLSESTISSIGKQIQSAEASFRLATVGIRDVDSSATGLSERLTLLQSNLQNQNRIVQEYENILRSAREQLAAAQQVNDPDKIRQASDAVTEAQTALNDARTSFAQTEQEIANTNQALSLAETNWYAAGRAIDESKAAIASLGKQMQIAENDFHPSTAGIRDMNTSVPAPRWRRPAQSLTRPIHNYARQVPCGRALALPARARASDWRLPEKTRLLRYNRSVTGRRGRKTESQVIK